MEKYKVNNNYIVISFTAMLPCQSRWWWRQQ